MSSTRNQIEMPDSWSDPLEPDAEEKRKFPRAIVDTVLEELIPGFDPEPAFERPHTRAHRFCPVGGYRRRKLEMKDLEILYVPRIAEIEDPTDLFHAKREVDLCEQLIEGWVSAGVLGKRLKIDGALSAWGPWNKHAFHVATGLPIDFFAATRENYFNRLVVTTGPLELNVRIAQAAHRKGYEWEVNSPGFVPRGGKWDDCARDRLTMRQERDVFAFVELPFVAPEARR